MTQRCLITGCALYVEDLGAAAWGDLHTDGRSYIFNACLRGGETAWDYQTRPTDKCLLVPDNVNFFERRGVIVVPVGCARLNPAAEAYIHPWTAENRQP